MKAERFNAKVLTGHKGAAVEVPFNPTERWGIPAQHIIPRRRGHAVEATLNDLPFESFIVPRSKRFFLLVSPDVLKAAHAEIGDTVRVVLTIRR
jgi:hypothetical protein